MARINLARADAGRAHRAVPGDVVVVRLDETPTSGHRWQIEEYDPAVLRPSGEEALAPASRTGGQGLRELRFDVIGAGSSRLALALRRAWEGAASAVDRFEADIAADPGFAGG
ncbi:inhibitor of cysteine peptidase [Micromonospora pattaloongensis]|uniref:Inhibitor of cysteine peptidase n=1 Tax=Micromonospora pattaloongensis TaxID=405436 RepID=A0A1H3NMF3_9ACTN|nr:protease inhibitor I42 family protein [Micromonospora pattaloongensis]SDY89968.1 inhibitor of cysteine peptidase [Micromonospora pattaloongensis]